MKTPMQELIEIINTSKKYYEDIGRYDYSKGLDKARLLAVQMLEKEKEQIINAVDAVDLVVINHFSNGECIEDNIGKEVNLDIDSIGLSITGENYYKQTFNTKE